MAAITKLYDVLIIGGGPAGLAVVTGLARQLHTALVFDSGVYRNAVATHMHTVPGWDHADPAEFRAKAKGDLVRRYPSIEFKSATVTELKKLESGYFQAADNQGGVYTGRKVALASGIRDIMPPLDGYAECWGRGIFHCLFCHGFEERGGDSAGFLAIDMFANPQMAQHIGNMVLRLAKSLTIYTNGNETLAQEIEAVLKNRKQTTLDARKIKRVEMASKERSAILLTFEDGSQTEEAFLAHHPLVELNGPFVQQLGLEVGSQGEIKVTPPFNETSVPGVYAAGDAASAFRAVLPALSMGGMIAAGLVFGLQAEMAAEAD